MQSSEVDEWVYHELLVHPALTLHPAPRSVFICGGGEGATAREVLRHKGVEEVVMVDIDKVVCDFCREHLEHNQAAFADARLTLIHDDARAQLEQWPGKFDVIIGDLADPLDGGPCFQLYTQVCALLLLLLLVCVECFSAGAAFAPSPLRHTPPHTLKSTPHTQTNTQNKNKNKPTKQEFYETVVLPKLNPGGIFITQSGPAGILSATEVFTVINKTLAAVFPRVLPYAQHMPVYCDVWGWNMALSDASQAELSEEEFDQRLKERVDGRAGLCFALLAAGRGCVRPCASFVDACRRRSTHNPTKPNNTQQTKPNNTQQTKPNKQNPNKNQASCASSTPRPSAACARSTSTCAASSPPRRASTRPTAPSSSTARASAARRRRPTRPAEKKLFWTPACARAGRGQRRCERRRQRERRRASLLSLKF